MIDIVMVNGSAMDKNTRKHDLREKKVRPEFGLAWWRNVIDRLR